MERSSDARDSHFFKLLFVNIKKLVIESIILEMGAIGPHIKSFCYVWTELGY